MKFSHKIITGFALVNVLTLGMTGLFIYTFTRYQETSHLVYLLDEARNNDQSLKLSLLLELDAMENHLAKADRESMTRFKENRARSAALIEKSLVLDRILVSAFNTSSFPKERLEYLARFRDELNRHERYYNDLRRMAQAPTTDTGEILKLVNGTRSQITSRMEEMESHWRANVGQVADAVQRDKRVLLRILALLGGVTVLLSIALSAYLVTTMRRAMRRLAEGMRRVSAGDYTQSVTAAQDGEINQLMQQFNRMAAELGNLEEMRRDFISMVSHDLRSPVSVIKMYADIVAEKGSFDAAGLKAITRNADRVLRMVDNFLDYSKASVGVLIVEPHPTDLENLVHRVIADTLLVAGSHDVTLSASCGHETRRVMADEEQLERALTNLVTNGIKYNHPGGSVTVRTRRAGGEVLVEVSDTGIGISEEDRQRLFVKYARPDRTRHIKGTGLGLAVSREIIKAHGSDLEVKSAVGAGTTFSFRLKAEVDSSSPCPSERADMQR